MAKTEKYVKQVVSESVDQINLLIAAVNKVYTENNQKPTMDQVTAKVNEILTQTGGGIFNEFKGVLASEPTGPHNNLDWYINSLTKTIYVWSNNQWNEIGSHVTQESILTLLGLVQADLDKIKAIQLPFTQADKDAINAAKASGANPDLSGYFQQDSDKLTSNSITTTSDAKIGEDYKGRAFFGHGAMHSTFGGDNSSPDSTVNVGPGSAGHVNIGTGASNVVIGEHAGDIEIGKDSNKLSLQFKALVGGASKKVDIKQDDSGDTNLYIDDVEKISLVDLINSKADLTTAIGDKLDTATYNADKQTFLTTADAKNYLTESSDAFTAKMDRADWTASITQYTTTRDADLKYQVIGNYLTATSPEVTSKASATDLDAAKTDLNTKISTNKNDITSLKNIKAKDLSGEITLGTLGNNVLATMDEVNTLYNMRANVNLANVQVGANKHGKMMEISNTGGINFIDNNFAKKTELDAVSVIANGKADIEDTISPITESVVFVEHDGKKYFNYIEANTNQLVFETEVNIITGASDQGPTAMFVNKYPLLDRLRHKGSHFTVTFKNDNNKITYIHPTDSNKYIRFEGNTNQFYTFEYLTDTTFRVKRGACELYINGTINAADHVDLSYAEFTDGIDLGGFTKISQTIAPGDSFTNNSWLDTVVFFSGAQFGIDAALRSVAGLHKLVEQQYAKRNIYVTPTFSNPPATQTLILSDNELGKLQEGQQATISFEKFAVSNPSDSWILTLDNITKFTKGNTNTSLTYADVSGQKDLQDLVVEKFGNELRFVEWKNKPKAKADDDLTNVTVDDLKAALTRAGINVGAFIKLLHYTSPQSTDPANRPDGSAIAEGDYYINAAGYTKLYTGGKWTQPPIPKIDLTNYYTKAEIGSLSDYQKAADSTTAHNALDGKIAANTSKISSNEGKITSNTNKIAGLEGKAVATGSGDSTLGQLPNTDKVASQTYVDGVAQAYEQTTTAEAARKVISDKVSVLERNYTTLSNTASTINNNLGNISQGQIVTTNIPTSPTSLLAIYNGGADKVAAVSYVDSKVAGMATQTFVRNYAYDKATADGKYATITDLNTKQAALSADQLANSAIDHDRYALKTNIIPTANWDIDGAGTISFTNAKHPQFKFKVYSQENDGAIYITKDNSSKYIGLDTNGLKLRWKNGSYTDEILLSDIANKNNLFPKNLYFVNDKSLIFKKPELYASVDSRNFISLDSETRSIKVDERESNWNSVYTLPIKDIATKQYVNNHRQTFTSEQNAVLNGNAFTDTYKGRLDTLGSDFSNKLLATGSTNSTAIFRQSADYQSKAIAAPGIASVSARAINGDRYISISAAGAKDHVYLEYKDHGANTVQLPLNEIETKTDAASKYQPRGSYLTASSSELNAKVNTSLDNVTGPVFKAKATSSGIITDEHRYFDDGSTSSTKFFGSNNGYKAQSYVYNSGAYVGAFKDNSKYATIKIDGSTPKLFGNDGSTAYDIPFSNIAINNLSNVSNADFQAKLTAAGITANKLGHFHGALASAPTTGVVVGDTYINTGDHKLYYYDGLRWSASSQTIDKATVLSVLGMDDAQLTKAKTIDQIFTYTEKLRLAEITDARLLSGSAGNKVIDSNGGHKVKVWNDSTTAEILASDSNERNSISLRLDGSVPKIRTKVNGSTHDLNISDIATRTLLNSKADTTTVNTLNSVVNGKLSATTAASTYATKTELTSQVNSLRTSINGKQGSLTSAQMNVINGNVFTNDLLTKLNGLNNVANARLLQADSTATKAIIREGTFWRTETETGTNNPYVGIFGNDHYQGKLFWDGSNMALNWRDNVTTDSNLKLADIAKKDLSNVDQSRLLNSSGDSHIKNSGGYHSETSFGGGAFIGVAKDNYAEMGGFKILSGKANIRYKDDNGTMTDIPLHKINSHTMTVTFDDGTTASYKLGGS